MYYCLSHLLPYLRYRNYITSWTIENRSERMIPMFIASHSLCGNIIYYYKIPCSCFYQDIYTWDIYYITFVDSHELCGGKFLFIPLQPAQLQLLFLYSPVKMNSPLLWPLMLVIVSAGLVLSSRLKLNAHSHAEVWSGFFLGYFGLGLLMWFF